MEYEFLFVIDGVSVDDDAAVAAITDVFDGLLSWNRGLHRLAVSSEGADAMGALRGLLGKVNTAIPAMRILWLDPDLVGVPDIAERTGHSRQNVQQWVTGERNGDRPFPPPEGTAGRSLIWRWADVNGWLKPLGLDDQATRPTRDESARIDVALLEWNESLQREPLVRSELPKNPLLSTSEMHKNLLSRVPAVTGRDLAYWFDVLMSGPPFLRAAERAYWLADEFGLTHGFASAIVHEYLSRQRETSEAQRRSTGAMPRSDGQQ